MRNASIVVAIADDSGALERLNDGRIVRRRVRPMNQSSHQASHTNNFLNIYLT